MIPFPNISPEIFSIEILGFELALRWYALSYILGFVVALRIMNFFLRKENLWPHSFAPMNVDQSDAFLTYLIVGVILGGRFGYVLFYNFEYYFSHPVDILRIWDGGMSFHGGLLGVIIGVIAFSKLNGVPIWQASDLVALATPPGLLFGRVANFINGELWGRPTEVPWGVIFPGERAQACENTVGLCARHPTQLYEAFLEGFLLFVLLILFARAGALRRPSFVTGIFMIGYGTVRFGIEYYRVPDPQFFSTLNPNGFAYIFAGVGITMGQALCLPMILLGVYLIIRASKTY